MTESQLALSDETWTKANLDCWPISELSFWWLKLQLIEATLKLMIFSCPLKKISPCCSGSVCGFLMLFGETCANITFIWSIISNLKMWLTCVTRKVSIVFFRCLMTPSFLRLIRNPSSALNGPNKNDKIIHQGLSETCMRQETALVNVETSENTFWSYDKIGPLVLHGIQVSSKCGSNKNPGIHLQGWINMDFTRIPSCGFIYLLVKGIHETTSGWIKDVDFTKWFSSLQSQLRFNWLCAWAPPRGGADGFKMIIKRTERQQTKWTLQLL